MESPRIPTEPRQRGERRVRVRQAGPTSYLQVAYHGPEASHPDSAALLVLDAIFSGAKAMSISRPAAGNRSSRLYRALVETEWATSADSSHSLSVDPGLFSFDVTARPERRVEDVERVLFEEIDRLVQSGVSEEELERARKQTRAQLAYSLESVANQAYWLGFFEMLGGTALRRSSESRWPVSPGGRAAWRVPDRDNRAVGQFIPPASRRAH